MSLLRMPRPLAALVLSLVVGLLALPGPTAPAAAAESRAAPTGTIVYLKSHNVYVARPDGSGERQITADGTFAQPWRTPSSADDGTVVAARGGLLYRMDQWGTVLNTMDPPDLIDAAGSPIGGPIDHAVVSPDGSLIAYTYEHHTCAPAGCRRRWATAVTASTTMTPASVHGVTLHDNPSWVTGSRLLLNGLGYDSIYVFDLARGNRFWFHDAQPTTDFHELFEPAVSRDGSMFTAVRGEDHESHIVTAAVNGNILSGPTPTWPSYRCFFRSETGAGGFASPAFAPDGSAVAWEEPEGVWIKSDPLTCAVQPQLVVPGAGSPHWSAADLQSTRPQYPRPDEPKPRQEFSMTSRPKVKAARRVRPAQVLRASAGSWRPAPTTVRYRWLRDGKRIKGATRRKYRVKRADRSHRIRVRVEVRRPSYRDAVATSRPIKVRR